MTRLRGEAIRRFLEWYKSNFPKEIESENRKIGFEKELPIIDSDTFEAVDFRGPVLGELLDEGWTPVYDDFYCDELIGVRNGDEVVTSDAGVCTVEINLTPQSNLFAFTSELEKVETRLAKLCKKHGMEVLGYGIQPKTGFREDLWPKKRRYEKLVDLLDDSVHGVTITSSDQFHVDIALDEVVLFTNVFNALTPIFLYMFANSPVWGGSVDPEGRLATREDVWTRIASDGRVGMPERKFSDLRDMVEYMVNLNFLFYKGKGNYIVPGSSFGRWMFDQPEDEWQKHWKFHEGTLWLNSRPRTLYSTLEIRPVCCQMQGQSVLPAAVSLGISENIEEASYLVDAIPWREWRRLRDMAMHGESLNILEPIAETTLDIAKRGLESRGLGEESLLDPLYDRERLGRSPAVEILSVFREEGLRALVERVKFIV